jgi:regulatory protein
MVKILKEKVTITAIKAGKNPKAQRSNLFLDGRFAFSLDNQVIAKEHLAIGSELSPEQLKVLGGADNYQRCLNAALRFLASRPRSEKETMERLKLKGYGEAEIEKALSHLRELNLLNDVAFAEYWKENRDSFKPRGQRLIKLELRRKGLDSQVINEAVADMDESEAAYRAAASKARSLTGLDFQVFRQKLGAYLQRRGFDFAVINRVVRRVWEEKTGDSSGGELDHNAAKD